MEEKKKSIFFGGTLSGDGRGYFNGMWQRSTSCQKTEKENQKDRKELALIPS